MPVANAPAGERSAVRRAARGGRAARRGGAEQPRRAGRARWVRRSSMRHSNPTAACRNARKRPPASGSPAGQRRAQEREFPLLGVRRWMFTSAAWAVRRMRQRMAHSALMLWRSRSSAAHSACVLAGGYPGWVARVVEYPPPSSTRALREYVRAGALYDSLEGSCRWSEAVEELQGAAAARAPRLSARYRATCAA